MQEELIPEDVFARLLVSWTDNLVRDPDNEKSGVDYEIKANRVDEAFQDGLKNLKQNYRHLSDPSPFKKAGCICAAIISVRPLFALQKNQQSGLFFISPRSVQLKANAEMAVAICLKYLNGCDFDAGEGHNIKPPFDIKYPSDHYTNEYVDALVSGKLSVEAVSLILESIFYLSPKGRKLMGLKRKKQLV